MYNSSFQTLNGLDFFVADSGLHENPHVLDRVADRTLSWPIGDSDLVFMLPSLGELAGVFLVAVFEQLPIPNIRSVDFLAEGNSPLV